MIIAAVVVAVVVAACRFLGPRGDTFDTYKININIDLRSFCKFICFVRLWINVVVVVVAVLERGCGFLPATVVDVVAIVVIVVVGVPGFGTLNNKTATINLCEFQGFFHPG